MGGRKKKPAAASPLRNENEKEAEEEEAELLFPETFLPRGDDFSISLFLPPPPPPPSSQNKERFTVAKTPNSYSSNANK